MTTIAIPDAYAPSLSGILADNIPCYEALQRLRHITMSERELYQLYAAILAEVVGQLPERTPKQ
jgi:hypothetical protein